MRKLTHLVLSLGLLLGNVAAAQHFAGVPSSSPTQAKPPSADEIWTDLVAGNRRFMDGTPEKEDIVALRQQLTQGQHPKTIVLACSDSRVAPELLFDKSLGELFVIRAAGNIADAIGVGSMEYAVAHLNSTMLIVLGHEKCGAVTAACSGEKMPSPNLQALVDKIDPAVQKAKAQNSKDDLISTAIRQNVQESARSIVASSDILQQAVKAGKLTVVEAVYKLGTGEVVKLGILSAAEIMPKATVGALVHSCTKAF